MISIISMALDLLNYKFINRESLFLSLFTLLSLIFLNKNKKYLIKVFFIGIIYDLIFTNYYLLHGTLFVIFGFFILLYYSNVENNLLNNIILGLILIIFYQLILFFILNITKINIMNFNDFLYIIKHFILINILYIILLNILKRINKLSFLIS